MNKSRSGKVERVITLRIMKKLFFALSVLAFAVCAIPHARGADISIDFIYDNLSGGNWIDVEGYGYGWQPGIATSDPNWRPYTDGYWAYTDYGWTWISYEDFGWATYHYGNWANLADYGWVWFPGTDLDWGPAWVSWRTGGDYIGWAPLPPPRPGFVYEGQPIGPRVDIEFDIGPQYYNFCDVRFIGEPVLRDRIFPPVQNVTYIENTVNVTNIAVQNNVIYNYGPDYNVVNAYSSRPIQRLAIERQTPTNLTTAVKSGTLTKVQGNKLLVAAPPKIAGASGTVKPPAVKAKVAQPKIEKGWAGVPDKAKLEQKIKTENPRNVPRPTRAAARESGSPPPVGGTSSVGADRGPAGAVGGPAASPGPRGKRGRVAPGATAAPFESGRGRAASENMGPQPNEPAQAGKERNAGIKELEAEREKSPLERGKGRPGAGLGPGVTAPPSGPLGETGAASGGPEGTQPQGKHKGRFERGTPGPGPGRPEGISSEAQQQGADNRLETQRKNLEAQDKLGSAGPRGPQGGYRADSQPGGPGDVGPSNEPRGQGQRERMQREHAQQQQQQQQQRGVPPPGAGQGQGQGQPQSQGGKKRPPKETPAPGPQ